MRAKEDMLRWDKLNILLNELHNLNDDFDHASLRKILIKIVPDFNPQTEINDILHTNEN